MNYETRFLKSLKLSALDLAWHGMGVAIESMAECLGHTQILVNYEVILRGKKIVKSHFNNITKTFDERLQHSWKVLTVTTRR